MPREGIGDVDAFVAFAHAAKAEVDVFEVGAKLFIEAGEDALLRRYSETRRPHPMGDGLSVAEGIRAERRRMAPIRRMADVVIDTSKYLNRVVEVNVSERWALIEPMLSTWRAKRTGLGSRRYNTTCGRS